MSTLSDPIFHPLGFEPRLSSSEIILGKENSFITIILSYFTMFCFKKLGVDNKITMEDHKPYSRAKNLGFIGVKFLTMIAHDKRWADTERELKCSHAVHGYEAEVSLWIQEYRNHTNTILRQNSFFLIVRLSLIIGKMRS